MAKNWQTFTDGEKHYVISGGKPREADCLATMGGTGKASKERAALIVRAVNANDGLINVARAAERLYNVLAEDLPCECHGQPDAIYEKGETCPPCDIKAALKAVGREVI